jgi:hypothetical protein
LDPASADTTFSRLAYVREALQDAETLLQFAAESGIAVDEADKERVLDARAAFDKGLDESTTGNLLTALTRIATAVSPVTPKSLQECPIGGNKPTTPYHWPAVVLALFIILYSTISFAASVIADSIRAEITTANALAVKLNSEFPLVASPSTSPEVNRREVIGDLQQFADIVRNIDGQSQELCYVTHLIDSLFHPEWRDPFHANRHKPEEFNRQFEVPVPVIDYGQTVVKVTLIYQKVRFLAEHLAEEVSFEYGAISTCVLPVLYAVLGTFAFVLRTFELRVSARSYVHSRVDYARFIIAAIGGAVVGLFSNFTAGQGFKASPLALAFLVGYAVDVFYSFLETLIQSFTKTALASSSPAQPPPIDSKKIGH